MGIAHRVAAALPESWKRLIKSLPGVATVRRRLYGHPRGPQPLVGGLRPVVYLPTWVEWDVMPQRPQFMVQAFADAGHPVWFVDPRLSRERVEGDRIHLVPNLKTVPAKHVILLVHFAPLAALFDLFEEAVVVYDILDDLAIYEPDEKHLLEEATVRFHHESVVERADLVTVSNPLLAERHAGGRGEALLVENGVGLERFTPAGTSAIELGSHRPIIGYHGAIAEWFDFGLVKSLAELRADWRFVLVGPVYERVSDDLLGLIQMPNVEHLPEQPGDRIAEFVRGFDVGLIPFLVYGMTEGVTPLKMYEYMACGVPVVATPIPACVEHPNVTTSSDAREIMGHIEISLSASDEDRDRLMSAAAEASWDSRMAPLFERLEELSLRRV